MKKKCVIDLYCIAEFGGAERRLVRIYNEIAKKQDCDIVFRGSSRKKIAQILEAADCSVDNIKKVYCFRYSLLSFLYLAFSRKYKSIHVFDVCGYNRAVLSLMKVKKIRTILTIAFQNYAYGLVDDKTKGDLIKQLNLATKVDVLFPVGEKYFKEISSNNRITVTPGSFTRVELFTPSEKKEKLMLFVARRLERDKNASMLVDACNICQDNIRQYGYKIMICGKDHEEEELRNKIRNLHIEDIIEMPGYVVTSKIFPRAEVYLCIDLVDNYPAQTITEAVACGCSLICTDVGYSRMCGSEDFSTYIDVNPEALAEAMCVQMKKNEQQKKKEVNLARKYALEHYSITASAEYFERLIGED